MSSQNTTSSSIVNDALARLRSGTGLPFETAADVALGPAATAASNEKVVSIHPVPTTAASAIPLESAVSIPHDGLEHDDADVQEYMNRLLKRSGSGSPQTPEVAKPKPTAAPPQATAPIAEPPAKIWDAKEFIPKSVAPEKKANLTALREVANQSQRSAIETSMKRKLQVVTSKYRGLAIATMAFGVLFMFMSAKLFDASMIFGIASFLFAIPLIWQVVRASRPRTKKQD